MSEPRFFVSEVTGFTIGPQGLRGQREPRPTYWVGDRAFCHREVGVFRPRPYYSTKRAHRDAHALCDRLNAEYPE